MNSYQGELTEANINKINTDIKYLNEDTKRILLSNEITGKSKDALIQNNILQNAQIAINILKGKADISQIEASIKVLKTSADLNTIKTEGEKINNAINMIEKNISEGSGMTKENGALAPVVNGIRAGVAGILNLFK